MFTNRLEEIESYRDSTKFLNNNPKLVSIGEAIEIIKTKDLDWLIKELKSFEKTVVQIAMDGKNTM